MIGMIKSINIGETRHVVGLGRKENACRSLEGKTERKERLVRSKRRWKDNMKMDIRVKVKELKICTLRICLR